MSDLAAARDTEPRVASRFALPASRRRRPAGAGSSPTGRAAFFLLLVVALVVSACGKGEDGAESIRRSANVVILLADDLGYGDLGSYGHPSIRTPHLDRLALEGQRWTDFYVASPVCSPSRAALLTGRLPVRSGLYGRRLPVYFENDPGGLPGEEVTLAESLREAGYRTVMIGKWHLGDRPEAWPTRHGFDAWYGVPYSNDMDWEVGYDFAAMLRAYAERRAADLAADGEKKWRAYLDPRSEYWSVPLLRSEREGETYRDETIERPVQQETLTRRFTEEAVAFLGRHAAEEPERPFFLYLAYTMPHIPLFRSERFEGHSLAGRYGDVVEEIDWSSGQIVAALEELGLADDTLVVFTSDNGPWLHVGGRPNPDAGFTAGLQGGKGTTFEGGMRVPAIFWWPGSVAAGAVSELGSTMDLFTTVLSLAGVERPRDRTLDGVDLSPVLRGGGPGPRTELAYYRAGELQAFRLGRFKIRLVSEGAYDAPPVRMRHDPPLLFHLGEDPEERFDLSAARPEELARVVAAMEAHRHALEPAPPELDRRLGVPIDEPRE